MSKFHVKEADTDVTVVKQRDILLFLTLPAATQMLVHTHGSRASLRVKRVSLTQRVCAALG